MSLMFFVLISNSWLSHLKKKKPFPISVILRLKKSWNCFVFLVFQTIDSFHLIPLLSKITRLLVMIKGKERLVKENYVFLLFRFNKNFEEGRRNVFIRIIIKKQKTKSCDHESVKNASHRHLHLNHRNETCLLFASTKTKLVCLATCIHRTRQNNDKHKKLLVL
jgi:hypothetical protein